jgi:hypothetical protein
MTRFATKPSTVIARLDRATQYAAAFRLNRWLPGVLDRPLEPVVRPAKGRTGWRTMTSNVNVPSED